jgi:putative ABC transport system ATP-binding protein
VRPRLGKDVAVPTQDASDAPGAPDPEASACSFSLRGVVVARDGRRILGPIDLDLPRRGPIAISGPSGAGKSSLLRLLDRLDAPAEGTISFLGEPIATMDPTRLRRRVAMVFQQPVVLPGTAADNLAVADPAITSAGVAAALERVGLHPDLAGRDARDLSGGEAQRLCLARSLATDPEVLLLDEPTSALDAASAEVIEALALELEADGITTIWVTHDADQLARLARHVVRIADGTARLEPA